MTDSIGTEKRSVSQRIMPRSFDTQHYFQSLRYALYTMRRPLDGFWDLIHEGRGSIAAANTIVFFAVVVEVLRLTLTNFQFIEVFMEGFNVVFVVLQIIVPLGLWVVANWSLTTLMEGKGRLRDIYMGTAYALTPMVLINAVLIVMSHVITYEEGALYWMMTTLGTLWFVLLLLCAMKEIHDYSFGKAVGSSLVTVVAIGVIIFIFIMFFAVVSDGIVYFVSLFQEIAFRFM